MTQVDWRKGLIEAHPDLFHAPPGDPTRASGYPWCEEGWLDLLDRMCSRIESALRPGEAVRINQLKEKFATLRGYWHGDVSSATAAAIGEAVALAEARSACTCERCGDVGRLYRHGGMYMTRCAIHAQGVPVPDEEGPEDVHAVRFMTARGFRRPPRRYDRGADAFVEMQPPRGEEE